MAEKRAVIRGREISKIFIYIDFKGPNQALGWLPDAHNAQHSAGCWPKWLHHGDGTRVPQFGQYELAEHMFFSAQWEKRKYDLDDKINHLEEKSEEEE